MIQFPHLHIAASRIITFTYTYLRSRNGNTFNKTNLNSLKLSPYIHTVLQSRFESQFRVESQLGSNVPPSSVNFRIRHLPTSIVLPPYIPFPLPSSPAFHHAEVNNALIAPVRRKSFEIMRIEGWRRGRDPSITNRRIRDASRFVPASRGKHLNSLRFEIRRNDSSQRSRLDGHVA